MLEKRRCWAWVEGRMTWMSILENGERWELNHEWATRTARIDSDTEAVEIPDAAWLERCKSDLRDLARAAQDLYAEPIGTERWREAKAVIDDIAPRYTTEASR